jgi:isoleucyl-tRNA synthetase
MGSMAEEKTNKSPAERDKSKIAEREEEILKFWQENKIFEKSLGKESPEGEFIFYEGPPTANGKPGIHHLEARAFKDVIPRYKTMKGFHVRRKGGWDTHGLPVELQVEKELGLKSKKEIEEFGVAEFNKKCKESVWKYVDLWEKFTDRIGYWVDQKNPYITYKNYYIEAVWNILKNIGEKKLLYKDYKVVPWCPRCETGLSSHELAQGYQDVKDTSVTVKFKLKQGQKFGGTKEYEADHNTYILAWTTTPWTLPGNVALAVGNEIMYVRAKNKENNEEIILAKAIFEKLFRGDSKYEVTGKTKGLGLLGLEYEPLFPYAEQFASEQEKEKLKNAFKVYPADFVTTEDGTGVVHTAVMYGQEDFDLGNKVGLPKIHTVNDNGTFKEGMGFLSGRFVKEKDEKGKPTLDIDIFNYLKEKGFYFSNEPYSHSYPFCWRCDTPLIYYARDSWYVKMSGLRDKLVKENEDINWVPAHIKEGRFGEWLREVKDWAISRERYWGTPLPVWQNKEGKTLVIGSIDELKKHTKKSGNKYFVMRHGEGEQNVLDLISCLPNHAHHLTEKGKEQAVIASKKLKKEKIDVVYCSPFLRTKETAQIIAKEIDLSEDKIIYDEKIGEVNFGDFDLKPFSEFFSFVKENKSKMDDFSAKIPNGESYQDIKNRIGDFIYDTDSKHSNKNILIVTHGIFLEILPGILEGTDADKSKSLIEEIDPKIGEICEYLFTPLPHNENYELDLHKPFIDQVVLVDEDGDELKRVKEVMDVWFDSGGMPFAQDGLKPEKKMQYPADFISEAIDQTRGWFYTMHAIGVLMGKGKAFKNVICLGHILDANGIKMSKHIGNVVDPWTMIDKYGSDALRMWMYTVNQPGDSKNFDEKTVDEVVKKIFNLAGNILSFYDLYRDESIKPHGKSDDILDKWIIVRLNQLIKEGKESLDNFQVFEAARAIRDFVGDFSTWYIRRSRDRFKSEDKKDRENALATTHFVLLELSKYMAPFMPFFAESLYLKLKLEDAPESVHLCDWPKGGKVDEKIVKNMEEVRKVVSLALEKRMAAGIKVRQPLSKLKIKRLKDGKTEKLGEEYLELIKDEVNVKKVIFEEDEAEGVELDTEITEELQKEGSVRDFIRSVQELRKNKNLVPSDEAELLVETDEKGKEFLNSVLEEIKKPTNISEIKFESNDGEELKIEEMMFKVQIK